MGSALEDVEGTVHTYKADQGYGFLVTAELTRQSSDSPVDDIFFHISDVPMAEEVEEGWRFEFDVETGEQGFRATNIGVISRDSGRETASNERRKPRQRREESMRDEQRLEQLQEKDDDDGPAKAPDRERWR